MFKLHVSTGKNDWHEPEHANNKSMRMVFGFYGSSTTYSDLVLCSSLSSCLNSLLRAAIVCIWAIKVIESQFTTGSAPLFPNTIITTSPLVSTASKLNSWAAVSLLRKPSSKKSLRHIINSSFDIVKICIAQLQLYHKRSDNSFISKILYELNYIVEVFTNCPFFPG